MLNKMILKNSERLGQLLKEKNLLLSIAESCTGGGLGYAITATPGSSRWFDQGFITYSNNSKETRLGVSSEILKKYGAVSLNTAKAMADGALNMSTADLALSITGIAGPSGGSSQKPVGTVCFAIAQKGAKTKATQRQFQGSREEIRQSAILFCLEWVMAEGFI